MGSDSDSTPSHSTSRQLESAPGVHCWVTGAHQINLPKGLSEHDLGWIIGPHGRDYLIVSGNRRWVLDSRQFETPDLFQTRRGRWVPEWHPSVERYLRAKLAEYRVWTVTREIKVAHRHSMIARLKWQLRRNGWDAEDLPGDSWE